MKAVENSFPSILLVGVFFTCLLPVRASAIAVTVTSANYPWWYDQWVPVGGSVDIGGSTKYSPASLSNYGFGAYAYSQGRMYCAAFDSLHWKHGAGGYQKWGWDIDLEVQGNPGELIDVYLDMKWYGSGWVHTTDVDSWWAPGSATARSDYYFRMTDSYGSVYISNNSYQLYIEPDEDNYHDEGSFDWHPDPSYLGRMVPGDTISITGYLESNANAYVGEVAANLTTQARIDSRFSFGVTGFEVTEQIPAPGAALLVLIGSGLLAASRRLLHS